MKQNNWGLKSYTTNKYADVIPFYTDWDPLASYKEKLIQEQIQDLKDTIASQAKKITEYKRLVQAWEDTDMDFIRERTRWGHRSKRMGEQIKTLTEANIELREALSYEEKLTKLLKEKLKQDEQL